MCVFIYIIIICIIIGIIIGILFINHAYRYVISVVECKVLNLNDVINDTESFYDYAYYVISDLFPRGIYVYIPIGEC